MDIPIPTVALSLLPVWRWRDVRAAILSGEPHAAILERHCADGARTRRPPADWCNVPALMAKAADARLRGREANLTALSQADARYPPWLLQIPDPPPVLWVRGQTSCLSRPAVALVGSRAASSYALSVAGRLGADLAARGLVVVSGLARGVDSAAHRGALSVAGVTAAVLGCGADVIYPAEHLALAGEIAMTGAVVSELPPGTEPRPGFFPRRNRLISGLARAVVVIEAGEKSGSLITARCALEQGRDVLAVPGNVLGGRNRGGHALLRDGARLVESADDVLDEIGLAGGVGDVGRVATDGAPEADPVLAAFDPGEPADLGQISARSGLPVPQVLPRLLELELCRAVRREPGGRFVRLDQSC